MSTPPVDSSISTITWALHIFIAQEGGQEQWDEGRLWSLTSLHACF